MMINNIQELPIRFTSVMDTSGYGIAAKNNCMLLIKNNFNINVQIMSIAMSRMDFSGDLNEIYKRINPNKKVKVNIVQQIPPLWDYGFQKDTYNCGWLFWETDKICQQWVDIINNGLCNEVWVSCQSNYNALVNSNVKKPIYLIPQFIDTKIISRLDANKILPIPKDNLYKFYSIFQWTERKNPIGLIKSYYNEFTTTDNVMLVVKTYGPSSFSDRRWIKEAIVDIKNNSNNPSPPPLYLFGELLKPHEVNAIHPQCDCYVYSGRGEGLNIPLLEAMYYNKQIITTKLGGISDELDNNNSYIIPHKLEQVSGQAWGQFYTPDQRWGLIDDKDIQIAMRKAYSEKNTKEFNYNDILNKNSEKNIINSIYSRLERLI